MLLLLAFFYLLWPLLGLLLEDKTAAPAQPTPTLAPGMRPRLGWTFYLLLVASVLVTLSGFVGSIGKALTMNGLGFASSAISSTTAVSGATSAPWPLPPLSMSP